MGYVEIIRQSTVIRIENGVLTRAKTRHCDGHGEKRSEIGGKEVVVDESLTLWLCAECDNPEEASQREQGERA